jgi:DNA-binding MarR family transcriptional regulator
MMDCLDSLVKHLQDLSGAEFKLAAYLYSRLRRRPALTIRTKDLVEETGLAIGSVQSASQRLAKQNVFDVTGGPTIVFVFC